MQTQQQQQQQQQDGSIPSPGLPSTNGGPLPKEQHPELNGSLGETLGLPSAEQQEAAEQVRGQLLSLCVPDSVY